MTGVKVDSKPAEFHLPLAMTISLKSQNRLSTFLISLITKRNKKSTLLKPIL